ncbi:MAG TPA: BrnT family toxin [Bryobacteraceae bacterium]|nr:BrnT family toxin [Bryobacteraceae bacterium]
MRFEWDARKAQLNLRKHRVDFADAATVFEDERALTMPDTLSVDEERWITLGMDALGRILVVVYTWRAESIRLISARPATPRERAEYGSSNET